MNDNNKHQPTDKIDEFIFAYQEVSLSALKIPVEVITKGEGQYTIHTLKTEEDLRKLYFSGIDTVWIEKNTYQNLKFHNDFELLSKKDTTLADAPIEKIAYNSLREEVGRSKKFFEKSYKQIHSTFDSIRKTGVLHEECVLEVVDDITKSVLRNPNALLCVRRLHSADKYTYYHSINVSVFASIFAKFLGYNDEEVCNISYAGILHDMGKQQIPPSILNAKRKLTKEEFNIIKLHPKLGCQVLCKIKNLPEGIMEAVLSHHEKYDGTGYPNKLKGDEIHPYASILSLADIYDALTSIRSYKTAFSLSKTASIIYSYRGQAFPPELVEKFVFCFGVYPIGSLAQLNTGDYGVVYENNEDSLLRPKIVYLPIINDEITIAHAKPIDLREVNDEIKIVSCNDVATYPFDLQSLLSNISV